MKPNASRPDGPTSLPASAGACDPRPYMGKARRDATRASEEYMRRVRAVFIPVIHTDLASKAMSEDLSTFVSTLFCGATLADLPSVGA